MSRNVKVTLLVALLILIGFATGAAVGTDDQVDATAGTVTVARTVVSTDTVTRTATVTRTHTRVKYRTRVRVKVKYRTVTEAAPAPDSGVSADDDSGCSTEYAGACVPADAGDVDCTELADSDFDSIGSDPYRLDADGDGVACES
jgi:hypothetical protein